MSPELVSLLSDVRRVSGETLAKKLGISRQALHKQILNLREKGYVIEGQTKAGYKLCSKPDRILLQEFMQGLKTKRFGKNIVLNEKAASTQEEAKILAEKGLSEGTVVFAEEQTAGHGRLGRTWESAKGGLWFSIILRPPFLPQKAPLLALASSVAIAKAIEQSSKINCRLKWPNDILVETENGFRKICGSLVEMSSETDKIRWVVLGIGIDVNNKLPKSLEDIAVTLKDLHGAPLDRSALLQRILKSLETVYDVLVQRGFDEVKKEYRKRSVLKRGQNVLLSNPSSKVNGKFLYVDNDGSLVLSLEGGKIQNFFAGDVTLSN